MDKKGKKGKDVEQAKVLLGRPGNTLQMGIVGLPNVGKSTTFNLISKQSIPAENFMFCTIDPNKAVVDVPDSRYDHLVESYKPKSKVPASLNILDIAGLVKGASENQGMGNAFLSHIAGVDGIYHLVRAFDDEEVLHYDGDIDPIRDLETIKFELIEKDKKHMVKKLEEFTKTYARNANNKEALLQKETLEKVKELFDKDKNVKDGNWSYKEVDVLNTHQFFTAKPAVYLVNLSEKDYLTKKNKYLAKIVKWVAEHSTGAKIIPFSAAFESRYFEANKEEKEKILADTKGESALPKIIKEGYHTLDLIHYLTGGEDEVKCWTIRRGTKAPGAAGVIHTDFERGFISADVMKFSDFKELGGEQEVKKKGLMRNEGKNYEVVDGDIIYFKFNVSDPNKKKK